MAKKINVDLEKNSSLFGLLAISIAVLAIGIVVAKTLVDVAQYNGRVIAKRNEVQSVISENLNNREALIENYSNLSGESLGPEVLFQIISTEYDFAGFTSIINVMSQSSGVELTSIVPLSSTESLNQISRELDTEPQPFEVSVEVVGNYDSVRQFISNMQSAAQPIEINSSEIAGEGENLTAEFEITSYFQQRIGIDAGEETVR